MLIEAVEMICSMRAEADIEEEAAQRAKEEAAKGGLDILGKVEEYRIILELAKQTNDKVIEHDLTSVKSFLIN